MSHVSDIETLERLREVKVGAFVVGGLALALALVFFLGQKKQIFAAQAVLHAEFTDVQGLTQGAPVRLAGVKIGSVAQVRFSPDPQNKLIHVELEVTKTVLEQLGGDPVARIDSQGLLGDKIIEIAPGSAATPPPRSGSSIRTQSPVDFNQLLISAQQVMVKAQRVAEGAARVMDVVSDPQTLADVRGSATSVRKLLEVTQQGSGLAHAIFYDPTTGKQLGLLMTQLVQIADQVGAGVKSVNALLNETTPDGRQLINNIARASKNIGDAAADLHGSKVVANAEQVTKDLAELTAYTKQGKGSLGALLMDPLAYDRLVTILGGVERSRILRAVVRYAIGKGEGTQAGQTIDGPPVLLPAEPAVPVPASK